MTRLRLADLYDRGLRYFDSLSASEKDIFVIHDLDLYYEMEGGFEDYFLGGGHEPQLSWLSGTLTRIGDTQSLAVVNDLRRLGEDDRAAMGPLCDQFFRSREERWTLLLDHLRNAGVAIDQ